MFENDWILSSLSNPTLDIDELVSIGGLNTKNTQFLSKDQYLKSSFIKDNSMFKNDNGVFSKEKFDKFYEMQASRWRDFQNNEFPTGIELDAFDTASNKANAKIKENKFNLGPQNNPDRVQIGIEGWRTVSERTKSEQEIAQSQKIFNPETGKFEDSTPEDYALFSSPIKWVKNLFSDPLVMAQYEEDTTDEYGNKHKKGEYKLNPEGTYYYERLNGRSPIGKTVLSTADILTPEDSILNNIDFMDSDDLEKSTTGVIAKNIALIAPMFTPAAPYYYKAIIAKELVKTLPMVHSLITNLIGSGENETPKWMNTLAAKGQSLSTTSSSYAKQKTFAFENLANLISDVALQWGQQKQIAKAVTWFGDNKALTQAEKKAFEFYKSKVGGTLKGMEAPTEALWKESTLGQLCLKKFYDPVLENMKKKQRFGADLSLAYMALISNTDVYQDMIERGATKKEAAWVALGSTAGMFSVDRFLGLGEMFYDELTSESIKQGRKVIKQEFQDAFEQIFKQGTKTEPLKWFQKGADIGKKAINNFIEGIQTHSLGGVGKAIGEGLEEVSEELVTDFSRATYSLLGDLGLYDKSVENSGAFENMLERYTMSMLGGAIGGGLFYGVEKYNGFNKTRDKDLVTLINEGKADELRKTVREFAQKGQAGNTKISGIDYTRDQNGNITWISTNNQEESQNQQIANRVLEKIDALEAAIVGSNTNLSQDQLFDKMVLQESRFQSFKNASHVTGYYQEFQKLQSNYLQAKSDLDKAGKTKDGTPNGKEMLDKEKRELTEKEIQNREENIQKLQDKVDKAQNEINLFLSGDTSLDYTRKLLFALDPVLNSIFLDLDFNKWIQDKIDFTKPIEQEQWKNLRDQWQQKVSETMSSNLNSAYAAYKELEKVVSPLLSQQQEQSKLYKETLDAINKIYTDDNLLFGNFIRNNKFYSIDSRLVDENGVEESEEEYNNRNKKETPDDILKYNLRKQKIEDLNRQVLQKYIQQFDDILKQVDYQIDSSTNRSIVQNIQLNFRQILENEIKYPFIVSGNLFNSDQYQQILLQIKPDLSNIDYIKEQLKQYHLNSSVNQVKEIIRLLQNTPSTPVKLQVQDLTNSNVYTNLLKNIQKSNIKDKDSIINSIKEAKDKYGNGEGSLEDVYNKIPKKFIDPSIKDDESEIPDGVERGKIYKNLQTVLSRFIDNNQEMTIQKFLEQLQDTNSPAFQYFSNLLSVLPEKLYTIISAHPAKFGRDTKLKALRVEGVIEEQFGDTFKKQEETLDKYVDNLVNRINTNPIYSLLNKIKTNSSSPLGNILKSISKEISNNPNELVNINYILDQVYTDYINSEKIDQFELNDTQAKQLSNAEKSLQLLSAYLYSASTTENTRNYFAHNKQINEFANSHKDVLAKGWELLPEIDQDYDQLLQNEINNLTTEIDIWKAISANNSMNKTGRLVKTEKVLNELRYKSLKDLSFKLTIDDKEYNLTEGLSSLPAIDRNSEDSLSKLAQYEQTLHDNFQKILKDTGISTEKFFDELWKGYLGSGQNLQRQVTSRLHENLKEITKYDQALYLLSILSDNPANYFQSLSNFIKDNDSIAPLTVQQNLVRLGGAAHTKTYKEGFKALARFVNPNRTVTPNIVHVNGVGGSGKTEVVLKAIRQRYNDQDALVAGPTKSQAVKLQNTLNESNSYTIDELIKLLVLNIDNLQTEYDKAVQKIDDTDNNIDVSNEYFTIRRKSEPNSIITPYLILNPDKVKFNPDIKAPLVFVDEAAHMNPLQIALIDAYAEQAGGTVFLASDSNQSGYHTRTLENLGPDSIFCTRTSKLQESLRNANIQKQADDKKVSTMLDTFYDLAISGAKEFDEYSNGFHSLIQKLNFRVYQDDTDINGDLLGADIDSIIPILQNKKDVSIGFIGDENSDTYQKLKAAGVNVSEPLTDVVIPGKKFMQGQEFDYVIIDENVDTTFDFGKILDSFRMMQKVYTLMSRSKVASIFLNKQLARDLGGNKIDTIKSIGFSIKEQVQKFREDSLKQLDKIDLSKVTKQEEPKGKPKEELKKVGEEIEVNPQVEEVPELKPDIDESKLQKTQKEKQEPIKQEFEKQEPKQDSITTFGDLIIEANTVVPIIGLEESYTNPDGTIRRYPAWLPPTTKGSVRRNLAAIYTGTERITKRVDKQKYQDIIDSIQKAVIFGGIPKNLALTSIPGFKEAWEKGKLQLEVREATSSDIFGIGTDLEPTFIDINGKKYIISVVYKIDLQPTNIDEDPYTAIFDICLVTDFNELKKPDKKKLIKDNINERIANGNLIGEARKKAEQFRDKLDEAIKEYENLVKRMINENRSTIDLTPDMYESHKTTRLVPRKTKRRLGGTLDLANIENHIVDEDGNYEENYNNFLDTDKRKVVSPVYIVGNQSDVLKGKISESIFGKAVVFVSSNTNLSPDELAERYINQKQNLESHTPEVRMVVLDNHGLSFTELVTHRVQKLLNGQGETSKKSWRMDVLGIRMFTAMWNFRAGLENFIVALDKWKSTNNYDSQKVLDITKVEFILFGKYGDKWQSKIDLEQEILDEYKVTKTDLLNLVRFNQEDCVNIPMFRLGIDYTNKLVGGYVRRFDVSSSKLYGKKNVNLLAIEEEFAHKYHDLLSTILNQLTQNEAPSVFKQVGLNIKPMKTRLVKPDGSNYRTDEYIGKNEQKRNLSGMIHTLNKEISIGEMDSEGNIKQTSVIPVESIFSFFPKAISAIATKSRIYQTNNTDNGFIKISTIDTKDNKDSFDFDIAELFRDGLLERRGNDNSLFNLFNLIFHGSVESIEEPHAYMDDAFAKYGFFVDPDLEISDSPKEINIMGNDGKNYTFLKCSTNPIYFDVNVDVRSGGIALNLTAMLNGGKKQLQEQKEKKVVTTYSQTLQGEEKLDFLDYVKNNDVEDNKEGYKQFIEYQNRLKIKDLFNGKISDDIVGILNLKIGKNKIKSVKYENNKVLYEDVDGKTGELELDQNEEINFIQNASNNEEQLTNNSFDSVVTDGSNDIMTHASFRNILYKSFQNDDLVTGLYNSTDIELYIQGVIENSGSLADMIFESSNIDEDTKGKMFDYLANIDMNCY